jgi:hypothetical protein
MHERADSAMHEGPSALIVIAGHVDVSEQLLADARRTEEAFRNPPPDWSPNWDAIEDGWGEYE